MTPIDQDMSIEDIINNGYKYYTYNGYRVKSSYIQVYGMVDYGRISEWISQIREQIDKDNLAMWVFIIFECEDNITYQYNVTNDCNTQLVVTEGILSRGTNIMPKIEKYFNS